MPMPTIDLPIIYESTRFANYRYANYRFANHMPTIDLPTCMVIIDYHMYHGQNCGKLPILENGHQSISIRYLQGDIMFGFPWNGMDGDKPFILLVVISRSYYYRSTIITIYHHLIGILVDTYPIHSPYIPIVASIHHKSPSNLPMASRGTRAGSLLKPRPLGCVGASVGFHH